MKNILLVTVMSLISATAFARNCQLNAKGEVDYKSICELDGSSYMMKQCKEVKVPGSTPGTYKYEYKPKTIGWGTVASVDNECDITIHECKVLAEKMLTEYSWTDECGQVATMKKVKFTYKVMNEIELEFKTLHKQTIRK